MYMNILVCVAGDCFYVVRVVYACVCIFTLAHLPTSSLFTCQQASRTIANNSTEVLYLCRQTRLQVICFGWTLSLNWLSISKVLLIMWVVYRVIIIHMWLICINIENRERSRKKIRERIKGLQYLFPTVALAKPHEMLYYGLHIW